MDTVLRNLESMRDQVAYADTENVTLSRVELLMIFDIAIDLATELTRVRGTD